jgi:hypothetical protein
VWFGFFYITHEAIVANIREGLIVIGLIAVLAVGYALAMLEKYWRDNEDR